jgi:hypothetical protein
MENLNYQIPVTVKPLSSFSEIGKDRLYVDLISQLQNNDLNIEKEYILISQMEYKADEYFEGGISYGFKDLSGKEYHLPIPHSWNLKFEDIFSATRIIH